MTILIVILSLIGVVALFYLSMWILGKLYDKLAVVRARRYCRDNDLDFVQVKIFPNYYGLYFKRDGKSFYASFDTGRNGTIIWKKGTPLDNVERKGKKGSSAQQQL